MKYLVLLQASIFCLVFIGCSRADLVKSPEKINAPFDGERFENIEPFKDKSFFTVLKWRLFGEREHWDIVEQQRFFKPVVQRSEALKMTMIGHSTVLIQVDNINILTDPHYSDRASPVSWAGPKRVIKPAIKFDDLPPIDVVLVSHNHYDHLDLPTLKSLHMKFAPIFIVGLGNKKLLHTQGIENVHELDWWESHTFNGVPIHFTPVQHWSARGLFDKRKTLWGGFYIQANKKIFFAGDTGYGKIFKMINEKYGVMDVGLLPIGAYKPRWFMKDAHINPDEAVQLFMDLQLQQALGIHFGTLNGLTDESIRDPEQALVEALDKYAVEQHRFIAPVFGQVYEY